jgi:transcriptional regulator with PAS, ATPase and Fis domain
MDAYLVMAQEGKKSRIDITSRRFVIGRGTHADLVLLSNAISREHCCIENVGGIFYLRDLGSTNGTFVNDKKITYTVLSNEDVIKVGPISLTFHIMEEPILEPIETEASPKPIEIEQGVYPGEKTEVINIDNINLKASEYVETSYLNMFYKISTLLPSSKNILSFCETLLDIILSEMTIHRGAVLLYDECQALYKKVVRFARGAQISKMTVNEGVVRKVLRDKEALLTYKDFSSLFIPIVGVQRVLGVVYIDTYGTISEFDQRDLNIMGAIGKQAGIIIENIKYAQQLSKEKDTLTDMLLAEDEMVGSSPQMQRVYELIRKVASTNTSILIRGESGVGKELVARSIHFSSPRRYQPLVVINCSAIPKELFESQLFGHEKGAFTGAIATKKGDFELANNGTLFLDEISDLDMTIQSKLLRALEDNSIRRVGGTKDIPVNVRILSATNADLEELVKTGVFRKDLYYRLNVVEIYVPPLRERKQDIPLLIDYFIKKLSFKMGKRIKGVEDKTMQALIEYKWPGNVRELKNAIERAIILCDQDKLNIDHFHHIFGKKEIKQEEALITLEQVEREHIKRVLENVKGNKALAAQILGITRPTLYQKIQKYNLET